MTARSQIKRAASATSPTIGSAITCAAPAASFMAAKLFAFEPTSMLRAAGKATGSCAVFRCCRTACGRAAQSCASFSSKIASCAVPIGPTVGPLAIADRSSPMTSDKIRAVTGWGAAWRKNPPPFRPDSCWRIRFIATISNPDPSNISLTFALSARVSAPAGAGSKADPPPEINASTGPSAACKAAITVFAAAAPLASGTGWPAAMTVAPSSGAAFS